MNPTGTPPLSIPDLQHRLSTCAGLAERAQSLAEQTAGHLDREQAAPWLFAHVGRLAEAAELLSQEAQAILAELGALAEG